MRRLDDNNWERLESVIRRSNMTVNGFAKHIGLLRGENLYQIKRGNNGISRDLAARIVKHFPDIDKLWLLTGEGTMISRGADAAGAVPFYREDAESSITARDKLKPDSEIMVPGVECDFAMRVDSTAMAPSIPAGSIVLLKKTDAESIIPGFEYVIVSRKIVTLRIVRMCTDGKTLRLVAADSERFDDILLKKKDIDELYKVAGKILINK
ncbi:MAG: S24 family peptidase [Alistipes sp.]|nr:S24 family peptidase [Alistipes sp.]